MSKRAWTVLLAIAGIAAFAKLSRRHGRHHRYHRGIPDPDRDHAHESGWRWNAW